MTGANFVVAESGRVVVVTNEGNSRFCLAATRCHIVLVGIEKILPRDRDLCLLLNLLARSGHRAATDRLHRVCLRAQSAGPARRAGGDARDLCRQRQVGGPRRGLPRNPALHPLRRLPQCLPGVPPGGRARLQERLSGAGRRRALAAAAWGGVRPEGRSPEGLDPVRRLPGGLSGEHSHPRPAPAPRARAGRAGLPSPGVPPFGAWSILASQPAAWIAALLAEG